MIQSDSLATVEVNKVLTGSKLGRFHKKIWECHKGEIACTVLFCDVSLFREIRGANLVQNSDIEPVLFHDLCYFEYEYCLYLINCSKSDE